MWRTWMQACSVQRGYLEQGEEVRFCGRQGLASQQLQQVPEIIATVEGDPLDLQQHRSLRRGV